jgi:hypothetical protein
MSRQKSVVDRRLKNLSLDASLIDKVDLHLFSELENRVPHGAWQKLMEGLIRQWLHNFDKKVEK